MAEEDAGKGRRIAVIGVSTIFLVAMVIAVTVSVNVDENDPDQDRPSIAATVRAVKSICKPTDYRKECERNLRAEAGRTTDPRELIKVAFNVTMKKMADGLKKTGILEEAEKDPRVRMALDTCKQLMDLSVDEFKRSLEGIRTFDLDNLDSILMSMKVWLSGAITYQETCVDGFKETSEAGKKMRKGLTAAMHMTSNALAIVTDLTETVSAMNLTSDGHRHQLVEDDTGLPYWARDGLGVRRLLGSPRNVMPDLIVAKDGSGKYKSIGKALKKVPRENKKPFVIYIKQGVYHEYLEIEKSMTHVVFVGDGADKTRITGNKNYADGINTYRTPTVAVQGDYFVAIGIGFENTAGPQKFQAVALRVEADKTIFYKCSMDGYQDTLYAHTMRQFYRECTISGTIDFIFGDAVAVFQNCTFLVREGLDSQQCIVTAQGRKERRQPSGIIIQGGSIVLDKKVKKFTNKAYLARPWKNHSRTIFMDIFIGELIQPDGYLPWETEEGPSNTNTCYYAEYNNTGPGSNKSKRVKWRGIKTLTSTSAIRYLPSTFFHGDDWIRVTKIPYDSGIPSHERPKKFF